MMIKIPGDWAVEGLVASKLWATLRDNVALLKASDSAELKQLATFLDKLQENFIDEGQAADFREKLTKANWNLTQRIEGLQADHLRDMKDIKELREELNKAKSKLKACEEKAEAQATPPRAPIDHIDVAPETPPQLEPPPGETPPAPPPDVPLPCSCAPSDAELMSYITRVAQSFNVDPEEVSIKVSGGGFIVTRRDSRNRLHTSKAKPTLGEAFGDLSAQG